LLLVVKLNNIYRNKQLEIFLSFFLLLLSERCQRRLHMHTTAKTRERKRRMGDIRNELKKEERELAADRSACLLSDGLLL
jgi:hypothetical protein